MKSVFILFAAAVLPLMLFGADTLQPVSATQQITAATTITLEAESAVLTGPMKVVTDGEAFGNACIMGYGINRRGWAKFQVVIPTAGNYVIWGRVNGRDQFTNSFFVKVDNGPEMIWETPKSNKYEWDRVSDRGTGDYSNPQFDPVIFNFTAGPHTIMINNREKETRLDRIIITNDMAFVPTNAPTSQLRILAPQMGALIPPGSVYTIQWNSINAGATVNIDLSIDQGATFNVPVVTGAPNTGTYVWNVPASLNRPKVVMRIRSSSGVTDISRGFFAVVPPAKQSITVIKPNGGETLVAGTVYVIKWREYAFNGLAQILFSANNGATWTVIAEHQEAAGENYWLVPNVISNQCLIKVQDTVDGNPWDQSNAVFRIVSGGLAKETAEPGVLPTEFALYPNFPNPFNPTTTLTFALPEAGQISLRVFDLQGRETALLTEGYYEAGTHQVTFDGKDLPSGVYIAVLQAGSQRFIQRMTLLK